MTVKLITITPDAEKQIAYMARVSNPKNQDNPDASRLLSYCIRHGHWSIFEMANLVVEIECSRAIARQILRHRSFSFQEFSQRYENINEMQDGMIEAEARMQDVNNRQNSLEASPEETAEWFSEAQAALWHHAVGVYEGALDMGIAKEQARVFLPEGMTMSRMYMNGTIRSWIHYLQLRTGSGTQKEHIKIAEDIKDIFTSQLPSVSQALEWT